MVNLGEFSNVLLELQNTAQTVASEKFDETALQLVNRLIPFDMAWCGTMSRSGDGFFLHQSTAFQLPNSFVPLWEKTKTEDMVAREASTSPDQTVFFDEARLHETPGLATLVGEHEISQALCTSSNLQLQKSFLFLSLYRRNGGKRFTDSERELKQHLMPHLCASRKSNKLWQSVSQGSEGDGPKTGVAAIDNRHKVVTAEKEFWDLYRQEYPGKRDQELTIAIKKWLSSPLNEFKLTSVILHKQRFDQMTILIIRERVTADLLTDRESSIAQAYIEGKTYKEIARDLSIASATARAHIRTIYGKFSVSHKSGLASVIHEKARLTSESAFIQRYDRFALGK